MNERSPIDTEQLDEWVEISPDGGGALLSMIIGSVAAARRDIPLLPDLEQQECLSVLHRMRGDFVNKGGREISALMAAAEQTEAANLDEECVHDLLRALDRYESSINDWCRSRGLPHISPP